MMMFSNTASYRIITVFSITPGALVSPLAARVSQFAALISSLVVLVSPLAVSAKNPQVILRKTDGMSLSTLSPARPLIRKAEYYREHGEIEKALALFTQAIKLDPKASTAYIGRARVWEEFGKVDKALDDFNTAYNNDPPFNPAAARFRGDLYQSMHRFKDAINDYSKVIAIAPTDGLYYSRGICYLKLNKPSLAIKDFDVSMKMRGKRARTMEKRADALLMLKQYEKALDDYNMALKLDPDGNESKDSYEHLHKSKAEAYRSLGKLDLAKKEITAASAGKHSLMDLAPFSSDSMK